MKNIFKSFILAIACIASCYSAAESGHWIDELPADLLPAPNNDQDPVIAARYARHCLHANDEGDAIHGNPISGVVLAPGGGGWRSPLSARQALPTYRSSTLDNLIRSNHQNSVLPFRTIWDVVGMPSEALEGYLIARECIGYLNNARGSGFNAAGASQARQRLQDNHRIPILAGAVAALPAPHDPINQGQAQEVCAILEAAMKQLTDQFNTAFQNFRQVMHDIGWPGVNPGGEATRVNPETHAEALMIYDMWQEERLTPRPTPPELGIGLEHLAQRRALKGLPNPTWLLDSKPMCLRCEPAIVRAWRWNADVPGGPAQQQLTVISEAVPTNEWGRHNPASNVRKIAVSHAGDIIPRPAPAPADGAT